MIKFVPLAMNVSVVEIVFFTCSFSTDLDDEEDSDVLCRTCALALKAIAPVTATRMIKRVFFMIYCSLFVFINKRRYQV